MKLTELEAALTEHVKIGQDIENLESLKTTNAQALNALESNGDLSSDKVLNEITRLQTLDRLLPTRLDALAGKQALSKKNLCEGAMLFVSTVLSPKIRQVRAVAKDKVRKAVAGVFSDDEQIEFAATQSDLVRSIDSIQCIIQPNPDREVQYVSQLLQSWKQVVKIEKSI